jgi:hypothetical protein
MTRSSTILAAATAVALAIGTLAGAAQAQAPGPAEPPPPGFDGAEFVDSRGCAFARVEVAGEVAWVPRVGPDRQPLCGLAPTQVVGAAPTVAPGDTRPVQRPAIRTAAPTAAPTMTPVPTPPRHRSVPRRAAAPVAPQAPRPAAVRARSAPPAAAPVRVLLPPTLGADDVRIRVQCRPFSARTEIGRKAHDPRCPPEPRHPPALVHGERLPAAPATSAVTALRVMRPSVPPGYGPAWTDGRLNPYRGVRTETGEADMRMIWTDTVPRRLVRAD